MLPIIYYETTVLYLDDNKKFLNLIESSNISNRNVFSTNAGIIKEHINKEKNNIAITAVSGFLSRSNVYAGEAVGFGMIGMFLSLSCPIFLLAGIGVLWLKPWGRKASLIATIVTILMILVPSYLYALWCVLHHESSTYMIIIFAAVGSILLFPILWFFSLPHVKERFNNLA